MSPVLTTAAPASRGARPALRCALLVGAILAGTLMLGGCGQKGALYLPQQKKTKVPPTQSNPSPETPAAPEAAPDTTAPSAPGPPAATAPPA
jgi:predicted small lipoprotein YifL